MSRKKLYARLFSDGFVQGDLPVGDMSDINAAHDQAVSFCENAGIDRYFLHLNKLFPSGTPKVFREGRPIEQKEIKNG